MEVAHVIDGDEYKHRWRALGASRRTVRRSDTARFADELRPSCSRHYRALVGALERHLEDALAARRTCRGRCPASAHRGEFTPNALDGAITLSEPHGVQRRLHRDRMTLRTGDGPERGNHSRRQDPDRWSAFSAQKYVL